MAPVKFRPEFKGERNYVQGPDIYDAMCLALTRDFGMHGVRDLNLSIHQKTGSNLVFSLLRRDEEAAGAKPIARLTFCSDDGFWKLVATDDQSPVTSRKPYSEEAVQRNGVFYPNRGALRVETRLEYSDIELWVSQNKRLLQLMFPDRKGKWWFVKGEFDRYSAASDYDYSELRLLHNFNFRLTKSEIVVDGVRRGFVYFSMT
jgi:hypothetical protein